MVIMWVMVMITIMAIPYIGIYGDDDDDDDTMVMIAIYGDDVVEMGMRQQVL